MLLLGEKWTSITAVRRHTLCVTWGSKILLIFSFASSKFIEHNDDNKMLMAEASIHIGSGITSCIHIDICGVALNSYRRRMLQITYRVYHSSLTASTATLNVLTAAATAVLPYTTACSPNSKTLPGAEHIGICAFEYYRFYGVLPNQLSNYLSYYRISYFIFHDL